MIAEFARLYKKSAMIRHLSDPEAEKIPEENMPIAEMLVWAKKIQSDGVIIGKIYYAQLQFSKYFGSRTVLQPKKSSGFGWKIDFGFFVQNRLEDRPLDSWWFSMAFL